VGSTPSRPWSRSRFRMTLRGWIEYIWRRCAMCQKTLQLISREKSNTLIFSALLIGTLFAWVI
jgi:hypothetical protein